MSENLINQKGIFTVAGSIAAIAAVIWLITNCGTCH